MSIKCLFICAVIQIRNGCRQSQRSWNVNATPFLLQRHEGLEKVSVGLWGSDLVICGFVNKTQLFPLCESFLLIGYVRRNFCTTGQVAMFHQFAKLFQSEFKCVLVKIITEFRTSLLGVISSEWVSSSVSYFNGNSVELESKLTLYSETPWWCKTGKCRNAFQRKILKMWKRKQ